MNILKFKTNEDLNQAGAGIIAGIVQSKPKSVLGLATGGTPVGIYAEIVSMFKRGMLSFKHTLTFNLDEYVGLPEGHQESYRHYMNQHLFDHIDLPRGQSFIPNGNAADPEKECERYDALLRETGQIDLQLLGLGHNGHIGFNEPDASLVGGTHVVELQDKTRQANARFFDSLDQVPTHAITMGVGSILKAKTILLVARGADKAEIVHRALTGPITTECPASLLQTHANVVVLLDQEAGKHFE